MKHKLITVLAVLGSGFAAGCTGCTKPIPLTPTSAFGVVRVGDEEIPAAATLVLEKGVLSIAITGTVKERTTDRLEWLRGSVPLGDLVSIDGFASQQRDVKEEESGALDVGYTSDNQSGEKIPQEFVSPYSRVDAYFPNSYALEVEAYDHFDLTITAGGLAEPISQEIRFTGRAAVLCVISPEEGGHAMAVSDTKQIREFESCAKLLPFLVP